MSKTERATDAQGAEVANTECFPLGTYCSDVNCWDRLRPALPRAVKVVGNVGHPTRSSSRVEAPAQRSGEHGTVLLCWGKGQRRVPRWVTSNAHTVFGHSVASDLGVLVPDSV